MIPEKVFVMSVWLGLPFHSVFSQVVISEVMFDPSGSEISDEFVELVNVSQEDTIDLLGWRLGDGSGEDGLKDAGRGLRLYPDQYAVILDPDYFGQSTSYESLIPAEALVLTVEGNTLGSGGLTNTRAETIAIFDPAGRTVDQYAYHTGNKSGHSDERIDLIKTGGPENWADSEVFSGTPGFRNSAAKVQCNLKIANFFYIESPGGGQLKAVVSNDGAGNIAGFFVRFYEDGDSSSETGGEIGSVSRENILVSGDSTVISLQWIGNPGIHQLYATVVHDADEKPGDNTQSVRICLAFPINALIINEIMYNPDSGEGEWIEIYNTLSSDVGLKDWMISDQDTVRRIGLFSPSDTISGGEYFIIARDSSIFWQDPAVSGKIRVSSKFPSLNNDSDSMFLFDPSGRQIDGVNYYSDWGNKKGISLERIDPHRDSNDPGNWHSSISAKGSTPFESNSLGAVETVPCSILEIEPNPFAPDASGLGEVAVVSYHLPFEPAFVHLKIFDIRGRAIKHLEKGRFCGKIGHYIWDGLDDQEKPASIGLYIAVLEASERDGGRTIRSRSVVVLARRW